METWNQYAVKEFSITSAKLLQPEEKSKLRTKLQPVKTAGETVLWHGFQIKFYDGSHWMKLCWQNVTSQCVQLEQSRFPAFGR